MRVFIRFVIVVAMLALAADCRAAYNVTISDAASSNGAWSGGTPDIWIPGGSGANVSVVDIESRLVTKGVTITTSANGADAGDINVNGALAWNANKLTLTAARDIRIEAVMTAQGSSSLAMDTASGTVKAGFAPGGGFAGRVDFPGRSGNGFLTINSVPYTVISSLGAKGSTTASDLQGINGNLAGRYALGADIDASATAGWDDGSGFWLGFAPLGNVMLARFSGSFDGLGHTIGNLYINSMYDEISLFSSTTSPAALRNVGLINVNIAGGIFVGGLIGNNNFGSVSNVFVTGSVKGSDDIGGLVGYNVLGAITGSYSDCGVSGDNSIGGLVGRNDRSSIGTSYVTGTVSGTGGSIGGLVGYAMTDTGISDSWASGSVTGQSAVGGLVGLLQTATIDRSYAVGRITGSTPSGGLVGSIESGYVGFVSASFWDTQTSGRSTSAAGTGRSTAEMKLKTTFSPAWSIADSGGSNAVWRVYEGQSYPLLRGFLTPLAVTANDASRDYDGTPYSGGNGVVYTPAGYTASRVLGTVSYGGTSQGAAAVGSYTIVPAGLYSGQTGYDISFVNGTLSILPAPATLNITFAGAGGNKVESTAPDSSINCLKGSPAGCSAAFSPGTPVTLKATADWKSTFQGWSGDYTGTGNPATITMTSGKTVTVTFDPVYRVKLLPGAILASIQDACDAVLADGVAEVRAQEYFFQEPHGVTVGWEQGAAKTITIKGGYRPGDVNYDTVTGLTTVHGPLTVMRGRLNVQGLNIR